VDIYEVVSTELEYPERVLVSAQTSIGDVPLDNIPWVFLKLKLAKPA